MRIDRSSLRFRITFALEKVQKGCVLPHAPAHNIPNFKRHYGASKDPEIVGLNVCTIWPAQHTMPCQEATHFIFLAHSFFLAVPTVFALIRLPPVCLWRRRRQKTRIIGGGEGSSGDALFEAHTDLLSARMHGGAMGGLIE